MLHSRLGILVSCLSRPGPRACIRRNKRRSEPPRLSSPSLKLYCQGWPAGSARLSDRSTFCASTFGLLGSVSSLSTFHFGPPPLFVVIATAQPGGKCRAG